MTHLENVKSEIRETNEDLFKIKFTKSSDGENPWYRCFDWSAYLLYMFPNGLSKEQRLKTKQYIEKDVPQGYVKVGFQKTSFKKYMGSDDVVNKFYQDNEFLIYDATEEFKNSGINLENYKDILEQWKKEVPIYEKKEKDDNNTVKIKNSGNTITNKTQNTTLFSVLNEILNFDTHNRDVEEYHKFICDVKNKILMTLMKVFQ